MTCSSDQARYTAGQPVYLFLRCYARDANGNEVPADPLTHDIQIYPPTGTVITSTTPTEHPEVGYFVFKLQLTASSPAGTWKWRWSTQGGTPDATNVIDDPALNFEVVALRW